MKLPETCGSEIDNHVTVVAAGTGMTSFKGDGNSGTILREIYFTTMPYHVCRRLAHHTNEIRTVICGDSESKQSTYHGDSGENNPNNELLIKMLI